MDYPVQNQKLEVQVEGVYSDQCYWFIRYRYKLYRKIMDPWDKKILRTLIRAIKPAYSTEGKLRGYSKGHAQATLAGEVDFGQLYYSCQRISFLTFRKSYINENGRLSFNDAMVFESMKIRSSEKHVLIFQFSNCFLQKIN